MKSLSKLLITSLIFTSLFSVNAIAHPFKSIETSASSITSYDAVSKVINETTTDYIYPEKSIDEITKTLEDKLNKNTKNSRYASGYYSVELIGKSQRSTGSKKIAKQPSKGTYFSHGGQIHYKDGSSFSVPLSFSAGGKVFGFSVGIGSFSKSPTTYAINIPKGAYYDAYVNKTYDLYAYKKYFNSPNGGKTFVGYLQRSELNRIKFQARKV